MSINWTTVNAEHVAQACEMLINGEALPRTPAKGIFILYQGRKLPAKHALRLAYCLANDLSHETKVNFSSGDATVSRLRTLGFHVAREGEVRHQ